MKYGILVALLLTGCTRTISTTDLRLVAHSEGGREWIEITAPQQALKINDWIKSCPARVEVMYQSPRVLSLGCRSEMPVYATFRLEDGTKLGLHDVIQIGGDSQFQEAVDRSLRRTRYKEAFTPGDSFALTAQGLNFPSPEGDIVVSSIELQRLMRPDAALLVGR